MNIKKISILTLCVVSLFSCEKESSDNLTYENATLENQSLDQVIKLARNFDKQLPEEELKKNVETYSQLNHEEMAIFIDERYKISLEEGTTPEDANLAKYQMENINNYLEKEYGQSYASATSDQFLLAYEAIIQNKNVEFNQEINEQKFWGCGSWSRSGTTRVTGSSSSGIQQPISYKGQFKLNGSGDCDLVYRSLPYYFDSLKPKYIYGVTSESFAALTARGSNNNSSKEVAVDFIQNSFEFLIGKVRVIQYYGLFNDPYKQFAKDTKIILD